MQNNYQQLLGGLVIGALIGGLAVNALSTRKEIVTITVDCTGPNAQMIPACEGYRPEGFGL